MGNGSNFLASTNGSDEGEGWLSVSDMMAGLMIIFLFIAITYIKDIRAEKERIEEIAVAWNKTQDKLYEDLHGAFKEDLEKWKASLDRETLSVRFQEPSILFEQGESQLKHGFKEILNDFFPRYISIIKKYKDDLAEVRIEGHTSSIWNGSVSEMEAYFKNMELSQNRTRETLEYVLSLPEIQNEVGWARENITANGLSSSKTIQNNGVENRELSRRVEFRVRTKAEERIMTILNRIE